MDRTEASPALPAGAGQVFPHRLEARVQARRLDGQLVPDLRWTAARDFWRQGVSEGEIMKLCGWKTRAMFDRYNIIDEIDLAQAVPKRFNDTVTAKSSTPATDSASLSSSPASSAA